MKNSNRRFNLAHTYKGEILTHENVSLENIFSNSEDAEVFYSVQEFGTDNILDLKIHDSIIGCFRDSKEHIILTRHK